MYYIVYKTINLVNNKFYIGKHKQITNPYQFDGYYGSGSLLMSAVKKYGKKSFIRETLFVFDNEQECLLKEEEIVATHLGNPSCYNMRSGGTGGFEHINSIPKNERPNIKEFKRKVKSGEIKTGGTQHWTETSYEKVKNTGWSKLIERGIVNPNTWEGLDETQRNERSKKISDKVTGSKNGSYGSKIYYNTITKERKRFKSTDIVPNGWIGSLEYAESMKKTHWYNDGIKNFLLKKNDPKIELLRLTRGRI